MKKQTLRQTVANNLSLMLEKRKLSGTKFAKQAGVSASQMYDVLAAKKSPTTDWLDAVCAELAIQPSKLAERA